VLERRKMSSYEPKMVVFSCKFGWGYVGDQDALAKQVKNWVPIICSSKIEASYILDAFRKGADGVLILGCGAGDCHYQDGNYQAKKRVLLLQKILESFGIEKDRLQIELSLDPEGTKIPVYVKHMSEKLSKMGPVKKLGEHVGAASVV
jgi:F420-non-reducing hydrogenase iron-sulfur subunit